MQRENFPHLFTASSAWSSANNLIALAPSPAWTRLELRLEPEPEPEPEPLPDELLLLMSAADPRFRPLWNALECSDQIFIHVQCPRVSEFVSVIAKKQRSQGVGRLLPL
ncbi:uncharacterized protein LOC117899606 [Drosophila subobscura]|uniref:uncharacterized protein LOC117899606 n=1 Tax=Drosophila subobscura TaxID=7241 RepID=UPI00155AFF8C|nr:uncharacterized protein LOC117899606 [Drosophila subobscura]